MAKRKFINIFRRQHKSAGFTLIELLVTVAIGWIVISGLIYFVVQLLRSDQQEFARTQTERDMSAALNYMTSELQEATYVYEGECLGTAARGAPSTSASPNPGYCPGLQSVIASTQPNLTPVLAFWKLEQLPYVQNPTGNDQLPSNCTAGDTTCQSLLITRNSYTLVVYSVETTSNPTWEGPSRIVRYQLRQYSNLRGMQQTQGYADPSQTGFTSWPRTNTGNLPSGYSNPDYNEEVLVDLVDTTKAATCSNEDLNGDGISDYSTSPTAGNTGFLACVRRPIDSAGNIQLQDAIVYIRGNAVKRAGASLYSSPSFYPTVQAQVKTRSTLNRIPPQLR